jgi:hypothetical protein
VTVAPASGTTAVASGTASNLTAANPQLSSLAGGTMNGNAPNGSASNASSANGSSNNGNGNGLGNGAPASGTGSSTVLPQTGHAVRTHASLWSLSIALPLIAAMLLVLMGCILRRRAVRLG